MMKRLAHSRTDQLAQIVRAKRRVHPELRGPLEWSGFKAICAREGVTLALSEDLERPACLFGVGGRWVIMIQAAGVRQLHPGAHELGHLWAHVDQSPLGRCEMTYHMDVEWPDDPREDEAEYIAGLLLLGPERHAQGR